MAHTDLSPEERERLRVSMVIDRKTIVESIAERARSLIVLDEQGASYLRAPRNRLTDAQVIALHLLAHKLAAMLGLVAGETMSTDDLAKATCIRSKVVRARASEMRSAGWIDSNARGEYHIQLGAVEQVLTDIERKLGGRENEAKLGRRGGRSS